MRLLLAAALLIATAAATAPYKEPPPGSPPGIVPAVGMMDRPAAARALDASRKPVEVLKFLGLRRGDRVVDFMAGGGYYSEIIGNAIGAQGRVVAVETPVFADAAARVRWAALTKRVPTVSFVEMMPGDYAMPANSIDFTLMHLVYHDLYWSSVEYKFPRIDPAKVLRAVFAATKPGGIVGVVDHVGAGTDTRALVDKSHRIDPAVVKADFAAAGFVLDAESDLLRMPSDDHTRNAYDDPAIKGRTDRVVYRFRKPA